MLYDLKVGKWQAATQKAAIMSVSDATKNFHTYALEWNAEVMKAFVDDSLNSSIKTKGLVMLGGHTTSHFT